MVAPLLIASRSSVPLRFTCAGRSSRSRVPLLVRAESPIFEDVGSRRTRPSMPPVFNPTRWSYHQNTGRYTRHLKSIFRSVTFRNLQAPLSFLTLVSCLVVIYRTLVDLEELPDLFEGVRFTDVPFQLTSFALSLLLVFRTDASYGRWCSAMDAWGNLRISTSQLVRKATAWVSEPAALQRLVRWVGAFPLCLMVELRHDQGDAAAEAALRGELRHVLRPNEVEQVVASGPYYHQFCLSVLTALIEATQLGESREATMLEDLNGFNQAACECEKIMRFPIPLTYTRHTSRFMLIYLAALPLALYDSCDWAVIPVTVVIAFLLLGIEDIGVQIEEPFSILPLPDICADLRSTAERAVLQREMVRCLADPDQCTFDPEGLLQRTAAASTGRASTPSPVVSAAGGADAAAGSAGGGGASPQAARPVRQGLEAEVDAEEAAEEMFEPVLAVSAVGRGDGGKGAAASVSGSTSAIANGNGVGRGTYIYSKGAGLVAAVPENGANGHGNGNGHNMMSGSSVPHHHQHHPHR